MLVDFVDEDLIRWDHLAISLQKIIMRKLKWEDLDESLQRIIENRRGSSALFNDIFANGQNDQVIKVLSSSQSLFADDDFRNLKVVSTDAELAAEMGYISISLKDVFNTWYRFAHSDNNALAALVTNSREHSFGTWQNKGYLDIWGYDDARKCITQNVNDAPVCGFIDPTNFYTNYYIRIRYNTGDDDNALIFVGFMTDSSGIEHTLSVIRGAHNDTTCFWAFVYDAGNPTQHKIIDYTDIVGSQSSGTFYFSAKRVNYNLEFKTSPANSDIDNENWTIKWSYPSERPGSMTQAEYDNIGVMLKQTNRVGFGIRSMCTDFYIDKQYEIFDDGDIYALHQDLVYTYNTTSSSWVVKGKLHDILPNRIFLYNARLKHFFFYNYWNKYTRITFKF